MPDNNFNPLSYIMAALSSIEKYKKTPEYKLDRIQLLERNNNALAFDSKRLNRMMNTAIDRGDKKKSLKFCTKLGQKAAQINKNVAEIIELCEKEDENSK